MEKDGTHESLLTERQGQALVALARRVIAAQLDCPDNGLAGRTTAGEADAVLAEPPLQKYCGTFVTLTIDGQLRGCIGSLVAAESIVDGVRRNASNAAFGDPRFPPLGADELAAVEVEVSILTPSQPLAYRDAEDLLAQLRPRIDGVIISQGGARATFLPQVWEQLPSPKSFLSHLCLKAMLPMDAWRRGSLKVETYTVQYFHEAR